MCDLRELAVSIELTGHPKGAGLEVDVLPAEPDSTTVDVYSHLSTERSRVAAARIDGLLKRRQAPDEFAI